MKQCLWGMRYYSDRKDTRGSQIFTNSCNATKFFSTAFAMAPKASDSLSSELDHRVKIGPHSFSSVKYSGKHEERKFCAREQLPTNCVRRINKKQCRATVGATSPHQSLGLRNKVFGEHDPPPGDHHPTTLETMGYTCQPTCRATPVTTNVLISQCRAASHMYDCHLHVHMCMWGDGALSRTTTKTTAVWLIQASPPENKELFSPYCSLTILWEILSSTAILSENVFTYSFIVMNSADLFFIMYEALMLWNESAILVSNPELSFFAAWNS